MGWVQSFDFEYMPCEQWILLCLYRPEEGVENGACEENKVRRLFCNNALMFYRVIVEYVINNSLDNS